MNVEKLVYGLYPKSNELRLHINRWEKGTIPDSSLNDMIIDEKNSLYKVYNDYNIVHTDPLFNWYDIFRPLALIIDNIELGSLTRFKETNTFYRMPIVNEINDIIIDPAGFSPLNEEPPLPLYLKGDNFNAFLPSPLSFYRMSQVALEYRDFEKKLLNIYSKILNIFKIDEVVLYDPLSYDSNDIIDITPLTDKFIVKLVTTGKLYKENIRGKPYSIISDYSNSNLEISGELSEVPGLKLIDGYNTKMEDINEINNIINNLDVDNLIVSHREYFDFLPRIIADKKLSLMSKIGD